MDAMTFGCPSRSAVLGPYDSAACAHARFSDRVLDRLGDDHVPVDPVEWFLAYLASMKARCQMPPLVLGRAITGPGAFR